jgi:Zn-dependent protease
MSAEASLLMMNNDKTIFSFEGPLGVRVEVGQTLMGLIGLLFFFSMDADIVYALMLCVSIILAIYLHELGHAWGNQIQGLRVNRIVLHGAGGFCESQRSATPYQQELVVAMGPIVNAVLWAVCSLFTTAVWSWWAAGGHVPSYLASEAMYFMWLFAQINFFLFVFNMIPVQPLDGGKLFHLIALRFTDQQSAQRITGAFGLVLSVAWIPAMIAVFYFQGWVLFFIPSIALHFRMMRGVAAY